MGSLPRLPVRESVGARAPQTTCVAMNPYGPRDPSEGPTEVGSPPRAPLGRPGYHLVDTAGLEIRAVRDWVAWRSSSNDSPRRMTLSERPRRLPSIRNPREVGRGIFRARLGHPSVTPPCTFR